ncbi:SDR family oxidoreductase [candidate division KSB1 bacterium]|nr:SDR family oxidoreductase [candidate division KSB1 bacterium]
MPQKTKALVTGGCGFIGSHLVDLLLAEGFDVTVIDNLSTGRRENLAHQAGNQHLHIVQTDLNDLYPEQDLFEGIDYVFHLAALADIVPSIERPLDYHRANVNGTANLLAALQHRPIKKFVYAASSSCYGIPDRFPTAETDDKRPQYPYALTKYLAEQYVMHWGQVYQLPVMSLRLFNVYGPRSRTSGTYGAVFGVFLRQKLSGAPFTVVGDGKQTRDFTFVTDVARAFWTAARSPLRGEIFNVGSGGTYSINLLTDLLGGEKVYIPKRPGEPDCTFADITKIRQLLGWEPRVSFAQGVERILQEIDYWRDAPLWDRDSIAAATRSWFTYLS